MENFNAAIIYQTVFYPQFDEILFHERGESRWEKCMTKLGKIKFYPAILTLLQVIRFTADYLTDIALIKTICFDFLKQAGLVYRDSALLP